MGNTALTILGFAITFLSTVLGSAMVYLFKKDISPKLNTAILGFAAGVMIAASVWSLLLPSLEEAQASWNKWSFVPTAVGFVLGGLFLVLLDKVVPHFHTGTGESEGPKSGIKKSTKMFLAVTIHNIPEGLAVGFAFGSAASEGNHAAFIAALGLAVGIAIQNFPEGAAISLPMNQTTGSKHKAFLFGAASGIVEPVSAILGYFLASLLSAFQPWFLAFAAGAMIFVVAEDLIPDAKLDEYSHVGTWGVMIGFVVMMILDIALG